MIAGISIPPRYMVIALCFFSSAYAASYGFNIWPKHAPTVGGHTRMSTFMKFMSVVMFLLGVAGFFVQG